MDRSFFGASCFGAGRTFRLAAAFYSGLSIGLIFILFLPHAASPVGNASPHCSSSARDVGSGTERLRIVTTIFPLQEFARSVAGESAEVTLLLPPGAGVHTWQPRASDILRLHSAHLIISIGGGLEPWLTDILRSLPLPKPDILAAAEFLPLLDDKHDHSEEKEAREEKKGISFDPHVWLDFQLDQIIVSRIAEAMGRLDPNHALLYRKNSDDVIARLAELHRKYEQGLRSCRQRILFLAGHAAFGYLASRYGLEQVSLYGLSPDAEPPPSRMMAAIRWAKEKGIGAVFTEANTNDRMGKVLARETGAKLMVLNPGSSPTRKDLSSGRTFFDIMEENLRTLRKGLGCE